MLQIIVIHVYRLFLTVLSPSYCAHCKKIIQYDFVFCLQCKSKIFPVISITRQITKKNAIKIFAISDYKDPLKQLIRAKNWGDIAASKQLGNLVWDMTNIKYVDFDVIVPIPLHWTRFAHRGFNQAQEIAQVLQNKSDKKIVELLKRNKKTVFQAQLTNHQRYKNVKDVFTVYFAKKDNVEGKHILLVDDLMTTGATIDNAVKVLLPLKPRLITVIVACRVDK